MKFRLGETKACLVSDALARTPVPHEMVGFELWWLAANRVAQPPGCAEK